MSSYIYEIICATTDTEAIEEAQALLNYLELSADSLVFNDDETVTIYAEQSTIDGLSAHCGMY